MRASITSVLFALMITQPVLVPEQRLTREEALIANTPSNADMVFQEHNIGALQPRLFADLLVLDRDYLNVPANQIKSIRPVTTLVGGRIVHGGLKIS